SGRVGVRQSARCIEARSAKRPKVIAAAGAKPAARGVGDDRATHRTLAPCGLSGRARNSQLQPEPVFTRDDLADYCERETTLSRPVFHGTAACAGEHS